MSDDTINGYKDKAVNSEISTDQGDDRIEENNFVETINELLQKEGHEAIVDLVMECFGLSNESDVMPEGLYETKDAYCLVVKSKPRDIYCKECGEKLISKGLRKRFVYNRNLYDGKKLCIEFHERSYECKNPKCDVKIVTPEVNFVGKHKRYTNDAVFSGLEKLKNLHFTFGDVSEEIGMSATALEDDFKEYIVSDYKVSMPEVLSVDEVYTNLAPDCKYCLVFYDVKKKEPTDLVVSRREKYTVKYFDHIPQKELNNVKYLISDMYNPYIDYARRYFKNCIVIIDSFHIILWLINELRKYLNNIAKKFKPAEGEKPSDEYYLFKNCQWLILKNNDDVTYFDNGDAPYNRHFKYAISTRELELKMFRIDKNLEKMRDLKEQYIKFNQESGKTLEQKEEDLDTIIDMYRNSGINIFEKFAETLTERRQYIVNSFVVAPELGLDERLSQSRIEQFNTNVKSLKRLAHGVKNWEVFRARILYAKQTNRPFRAIPQKEKDVHTEGKHRGKYKKKTNGTPIQDYINTIGAEYTHSMNVSVVLYDRREKRSYYLFGFDEEGSCQVLIGPTGWSNGKCVIKNYKVDELDAYFRDCIVEQLDGAIGVGYLQIRKQLEKLYRMEHE